ncbi:polymerase [Pedobacter changchengzhani]|uniref:Polymerase n=1 Tax=Pedobacter changchengzhani TaxID=2529274 RepID=A0A4R5MQB0_9SPHI|nr:polymerase [Pedobacter changchengzhani]TDG38004.1 polymerase [Pedobacter changchengzhani]
MKKLCALVFLILISLSGAAQMKLIKKLLSNEKDTLRKASFLPIPSFGYAQETGLQFGVGAILGFYADRLDTTNRPSSVTLNLNYSTKKAYNLSSFIDVWGKGNKLHYQGEFRFKKLPFNFYGIGNNTHEKDEDKLVQQQFKVLLQTEKQLLPNAYTGFSLGFENYKYTDLVADGIFSKNQYYNNNTGSVLYLGISQSYDSRNNNNYTTKGFFIRGTYQYAPSIFKSSDFTGSQFKIDTRNFWKLNAQFAFGVQGLYNSVIGKNTPVYLLPQMGNDEMMRGYYGGRYRDKHLLAFQAELRYRLSSRFGATAFGGTGTVWGVDDFSAKTFKPNYGAGLRYFFDPEKGISVRLDYGIGEKKVNEKRQSGFYISIAEAF